MSLADFYERFTSWKWNSCDPVDEIQLDVRTASIPDERRTAHRAGLGAAIDESLAEAVRLFASGELQAFVILSQGERRLLSPRSWREGFFLERLFLADDIGAGHGAEFDAAAGRTPFVTAVTVNGYFRANAPRRSEMPSSVALREFLIGLAMDGVATADEVEDFRMRWVLPAMASRPAPDKYDPKKQAAWTLIMALNWLVWRWHANVRDAIEEYRAESFQWVSLKRRLPLNGGAGWYEVDGAELQPRRPLTVLEMGVTEALEEKAEYSGIVMSVRKAREDLWTKLTEAKLIATGIDAGGNVVQIPSNEWPYLALEADRNLRDRLVLASSGAHEPYRKVTVRRSDVISLWSASPEPPDVPMISMLVDDSTWSFIDAATWVGCRGLDIPSQEIADRNLVELGASELFRALFAKRGLVATGLNRKSLREPIPAEYWELATLDPGSFRERHYLSLIDDVLKGYGGGQLTPVGDDTPRWFRITLAREEMLTAFPHIAASLKLSVEAGSQSVSVGSSATKGRKAAAAIEALTELYPRGVPKGLAEKSRVSAVNVWLKAHGHSEISQRTLARAIKDRGR